MQTTTVNIIVDYGMGNLRSIQSKLERSGVNSVVSGDTAAIGVATRLILPGVGHFREAMANLRRLGLIEILNEKVLKAGVPIFGICLGFQLFANHSEEGDCEGLGWIDAEVKRFDFTGSEAKLPVPHVGWSGLNLRRDSPIFNDVPIDHRFYFTHSYHMVCADDTDIIATADYGGEFTAAIQRNNIMGTQFHPEKSHKGGFALLHNWTAN